jgi:uncharacterized protein UPF0236
MPTNSDEILQQVRAEFEAILSFVLEASPNTVPDADTMERRLFRQLFALGCTLLRLYFQQQDRQIASATTVGKEGRELPFHSHKERKYLSIFGEVRFERRYHYLTGEGRYPLDATLNLPVAGASDLLREWRERLSVYGSYHKATDDLEELLGHRASTRQIKEEIAKDAGSVAAFYEQVPEPPSDPEATILVVQADGKGVPMRKATEAAEKVRKGKGEKISRKKEAIVTSIYTIAPSPRTPEEVVASLFEKERNQTDHKERAAPTNKRLFATLEGKDAALTGAAKHAWKHQGPHIQSRVALTDGAEPLQKRMLALFVGFVLVLDCIHAIEYLWKAANALLGETSEARTDWVKARALKMLSGQTQSVIDDLRQVASSTRTKKTARTTLATVANYYERNLPYMRYDEYLAAGWPIGTGVIEGACRHLVKDRCELSGMRWSKEGAEALLQLRSVAENGDWNEFHAFRRAQRRITLYGDSTPTGQPVELKMVA